MRARAAAFLVVVGLVACSPRAEEARLLLNDIQAVGGQSELSRRSGPIERVTGTFGLPGAPIGGDLYRPVAAKAGLVLVPGVSETGKDDPRIVALARSFARVEFLVFVPDLPRLKELKVRAEDADGIVRAVAALAERPELPKDASIGIAAISYAVGPAMLAALQPGTEERVGFVLGVGGYYDLERVIGFFTTGTLRGASPGASPHPYGKWVFALSNVDFLPLARERAAFETIARRRMANDAAAVDDLRPALGPGRRRPSSSRRWWATAPSSTTSSSVRRGG